MTSLTQKLRWNGHWGYILFYLQMQKEKNRAIGSLEPWSFLPPIRG